jgi:hypothetical protein
MVKPTLPQEIALQFPVDVLRVINSFVPHTPKIVTPDGSPSLKRELLRLQNKMLSQRSAMYMYELEDFMLDGYCRKNSNC